MESFRDAVFLFESAALPPEVKLLDAVVEQLKAAEKNRFTLFQHTNSLDEAAPMIDAFKARTCGSAYTLAVININQFGSVEELEFLLRPDVLGDPRTIFVGSIRSMAGAVYGFAKNKIQRECESWEGAPSCLDCYGATNKDDVAARVVELVPAYLEDADARSKTRRFGPGIVVESKAMDVLRKHPAVFWGNKTRSGVYRTADGGAENGPSTPAKIRESWMNRRPG